MVIMMVTQESRILSITIVFVSSLVNKYAVASLENCQKDPNTLWDVELQRCVMCLNCPPGTGYTGTFPCGYGVEGERGSCSQCDAGEFQPDHGRVKCTACTQCSDLNRVVTRNCSNRIGHSYDATCGECLPDHVSLSSGNNSTCVPCAEAGCQTHVPTTTDAIQSVTSPSPVTSPDFVSQSIDYDDFAIESTPVTDYWWTFLLAGIGLLIIIVVAVYVIRRKRNRSPSATNSVVPSEKQDEHFEEVDVESGVSSGRPNTNRRAQKHVDVNMETAPFIHGEKTTFPWFIGQNFTDGVNASSRSSSGYISQGDELLLQFPRDAYLRHRYDQAMEILHKDAWSNILVMACGYNILFQLSTELNPQSAGTQNWKHLGSFLGVPNRTLDNFKREDDPLLCVLQFADTRDALKLDVFLPKLKKVENHKALDIIVKYVLELSDEKLRSQEGQDKQLGLLDKDTSDIVGYVPELEGKFRSQEGQDKQLLDKDTTEVETIL